MSKVARLIVGESERLQRRSLWRIDVKLFEWANLFLWTPYELVIRSVYDMNRKIMATSRMATDRITTDRMANIGMVNIRRTKIRMANSRMAYIRMATSMAIIRMEASSMNGLMGVVDA